jgi:hypothetical protein
VRLDRVNRLQTLRCQAREASRQVCKCTFSFTASGSDDTLTERNHMLIRDRNRLHLLFTHVIGSLPRPQVVRDLLARRQQLPAERFERLMDEMVIFAMRLQEQAGIDVISDGEWRRVQYVDEFLDRIGGFERARRYEHAGEVKYHRVVVRKLDVGAPVFAKDAQFLAKHTDRCTKFALFPAAVAAINRVVEGLDAELIVASLSSN